MTLDFAKAFDKVPHQRLITKLKKLGIDGKILSWIEHWLYERTQRVILNGSRSQWRPVVSGVPQGSVLGPLLFIIYVNDMGNAISSNISKFADDTKIYRDIKSDSDSSLLQSDPDKLVLWASEWQMTFNAKKYKVLHFGKNNKKCDYELNGTALDGVSVQKDLGIDVSDDLKSARHIDEIVLKSNRILVMISRNIESKTKDIIIPLYTALVRPHLEYCVQAWNPHYVKDIIKLERVQRRAVRMIKDLRGIGYKEKLKELGLFSLERRRIRGDMIEVFKIINGIENVECSLFFHLATHNRPSRRHDKQIVKQKFRTDTRKFFFSQRVINDWNSLPRNTVECKTVLSFKRNLDVYMNNVSFT